MKQKQQIMLLTGLLGLAATVFYIDAKGPSLAGGRPITEQDPPIAIENPSLRRDKLKISQETEYKSNGRDLFSEVVAPAPVAKHKPVVIDHGPMGPVQPPPPPPPKLPVKFYGFGTVPNKRAFLTDGDEIYIVGEGDTLLGKYRILKISNAMLDFEEISSGMRGTAPLEEQAAPGAPAQ